MSDNIFLDRSNWLRLPVSNLKQGMFVASLDRPWMETPFLTQGFVISSEAEIRKLREYCKYVYVDKGGSSWRAKKDPFRQTFGQARGTAKDPDKAGLADRVKGKDAQSLVATINMRTPYPVTTAVAEEHRLAYETYSRAREVTADILNQAGAGNAIETEAASEVVRHCVDSILRNPDALMWMTKNRHMESYRLEHSINVCVLAITFGRHLRLDTSRLEKLGMAGLLHDVGTMQIPEQVLNKTGALSEEEFTLIRSHTTRGRDLLLKSGGSLSYSMDAAVNHHERADGKGYPRGLLSHELSDYARIISIVDAFDAMISERHHAPAKSTHEALKVIFRERGKQFDEELALEFIQLIGPYPPGTLVELQNGCVALVLSSQMKKRHLPLVKVVLDNDKQQLEPYFLNLQDVEQGTVARENLIARVLKDGSYGVSLEDFEIGSELASQQQAVAEDDESESEDQPGES